MHSLPKGSRAVERSSCFQEQLITPRQASLAARVPMADDITVEADSGGHTDNRLLPSILALRDELESRFGYQEQVRVGAAGGIGTPHAVLAAFMMGGVMRSAIRAYGVARDQSRRRIRPLHAATQPPRAHSGGC